MTTCPRYGKIMHPSRAEANRHKREAERRHPGRIRREAYKCPFCRCWHFGSKLKLQNRRKMETDE